jgi:hypothetical protein
MSIKIPMTPSEIEFATFRLVVQYFNQIFHRLPAKILLTERSTNVENLSGETNTRF